MKTRSISLVLLLILSLSAIGGSAVFAQDATTEDVAERPFVGLTYNTNEDGQIVVQRVNRGSPAAEAGIERGDIITAVDGEAVTAENLVDTISAYAPGDTITITVERADEVLDLEVTLGQQENEMGAREGILRGDFGTIDMTPFLGVSFEMSDDGVVITEVAEDSPAAEAGLQAGDVIVAINDVALSDARSAIEAVHQFAPGDSIRLTVLRDGEELTLDVTLGDRAVLGRFDVLPRDGISIDMTPFLGVSIETSDDGVVITEVAEDSPAAEVGLQAGDVIVAINDVDITDTRGAIEAIRQFTPGDGISLTVLRDGEELTLDVTLGRQRIHPMDIIISGNDEIVYHAEESAWEIVALDDNSALAEAGLMAGDKIVAIDGEVYAPGDVRGIMGALVPDVSLMLTVERDGETLEIEVPGIALLGLLVNMRGELGSDGFVPLPGMFSNNRAFLGVTYLVLDEDVAADNDMTVTEGALITAIEADSPAAESGLEEGDVITAVDGDVVDAERTLGDRISAYEPDDTVVLTVLRDDETLELEVTLGHFSGLGLDHLRGNR